MRKHKFKAWSIPEKRWINLNGFCISFNGCDDEGAVYEITEQGVLYVIAVEDVQIVEWTGLKDKNGKEVYEGDLVKDNLGYGAVEYRETRAGFRLNYVDGLAKWFLDYTDDEFKTIEVIGNIYDLKGESQ